MTFSLDRFVADIPEPHDLWIEADAGKGSMALEEADVRRRNQMGRSRESVGNLKALSNQSDVSLVVPAASLRGLPLH